MNAHSTSLQEPPAKPDPAGATAPAASHGHGPGPKPGEGRPPRIGVLIFFALLIVSVAFIVGFLPRMREREMVKSDMRELAVPTVAITHPAAGKASAPPTLSGELRPLAEASIFARASGYVLHWNVDLGAQVKQGQLLAELDTPELNRDSAQARAELAQGEAALALAESTSKRWREMLAAKTVSPQETDEKIAEVDLKRAMVEASKAKVQRLDDLAGYSKITAPFAGKITARNVDVGNLVTVGSGRELFRLANTEQLRLFVRVPQSFVRAIVVGQMADLTLPEAPGRKFTGKIVRTAGAVDAASRTLLVEVTVDNQTGDLLAGSYAQVRFTDAHGDVSLTLPSNTLLFRPEGTQVALVKDGHIQLRVVTLGRDFGGTVEVAAGVDAADQVVVNPADSILDGQEIRLAEPKPAAPPEAKKAP